jgi:hypothetical protein
VKATLDKLTLTIDSGAGFSETTGTQPHRQTLSLPTRLADQLLRQARRDKSRLVIDSPELKKKVTFSGLSIIGPTGADDPFRTEITVVDDRFWWAYNEYYYHFNSPRKSGNRRRIDNQAPLAQQPVIDDLSFAAWSLKDGKTRWTMEEVIERVCDDVIGAGRWFIRGKSKATFPDVEDLKLSGSGQIVIAQLLAELGGAFGIYRQKSGQYVIYSTLDENDRDAFGAPPSGLSTRPQTTRPAIIGEGYWGLTDREMERPEKIRVLFERVIEARMDHSRLLSASATADRIAPPLTLTMVIESPEDFTHQGRDILVGQWVEFEFYLDFLKGKQPSGLPVISDDLIADVWMSGALEAYGDPSLDPSGLWGRRIDAIRDHYRATFQLNQAWRDRIADIQPVRVAVSDWENRTRATAPVFVDYAVKETWRSRGTSIQAQPEAFDQVKNRYANPKATDGGQIVGTPYTDLIGAYAQFAVEDREQGIVSIQFGTGNDTTARFREVYRSALTRASVPTQSTVAKNMWLQWGKLIKNYELSVIATIILGSPADSRRYHVEEVTLADAVKKLPFPSAPKAKGPPMDVAIPAALAVSRHAWEDSRANNIYQLFAPFTGAPPVNPASVLGEPTNKTQLREIALARAAAIYASYHDHVIGRLGTGLEPDITIEGKITKVSHVAIPKGAITRVQADQAAQQIDFLALLPKAVRKTVDQIVDTGPAGGLP